MDTLADTAVFLDPKSVQYPHVALLVETSTSFGRRVLQGISLYLREHGPWAVFAEQRSLYDPAPPWLKNWQGDGIISRAAYPELAELIVKSGVPAVDLNDQVVGLGLPWIRNDHEAIGRMAATHLLERGFTRFGFVGHPGIYWSEARWRGFAETIQGMGWQCDAFRATGHTRPRYHQRSWEQEMDNMAAWLRLLPKPVGLLACNDYHALQVLEACHRANVTVPEEIAVIGVDDEEVAYQLTNPPLSSVVPNALEIGYQAAAMLTALMQGKELPEREVLVPPTGIVTRRSTDITAISDAKVAVALGFIRQNACRGIDVDDVLRRVLVSRSVLQRRFQKAIGKPIHAVILAERMRRVKDLLVETQLPRDRIARQTGFDHPEYLSRIFRQHTGMTMSGYRREYGRKSR